MRQLRRRYKRCIQTLWQVFIVLFSFAVKFALTSLMLESRLKFASCPMKTICFINSPIYLQQACARLTVFRVNYPFFTTSTHLLGFSTSTRYWDSDFQKHFAGFVPVNTCEICDRKVTFRGTRVKRFDFAVHVTHAASLFFINQYYRCYPPSLFLTIVLPGVFVRVHLECYLETEMAIFAARTNIPALDFKTWPDWYAAYEICPPLRRGCPRTPAGWTSRTRPTACLSGCPRSPTGSRRRTSYRWGCSVCWHPASDRDRPASVAATRAACTASQPYWCPPVKSWLRRNKIV